MREVRNNATPPPKKNRHSPCFTFIHMSKLVLNYVGS